MEVDWDLHAVVRGCTSSANTAVTTTTTSFNGDLALETPPQQIQSWFSSSVSSFGTGEQSSNNGHLFTLDDPFEARTATEELHELYKPFFPKSPHHLHQPPINSPRSILTSQQQPFSSSISSITCSSSKDQTPLKHQQQQRPSKQSHHASSASSSTTRTKRRKNQLKRVCHVPAEGLSSDVWAWRKYGQKPIKGSPFPRGYYRCSSSKGCLARKQVERNRSDPGMFIVTFTAEHNHPAPTHRNSLAGSTRQKPLTPQTVTGGGSESNKPSSPSSSTKPTFSSPSPTTSMEEEAVPQSGNTESRELDLLEEEEENGLALSDIGISDDFFSGLEGLGSGNSLPDHFPASFGLPWAAENAATAAGGI